MTCWRPVRRGATVPDLAEFAAGPDLAHAAVAQAALDAIATLADHLEQLADSFLLGQTAADFAQTALAAVTQLQQAVTTQGADLAAAQTAVADLEARVAALENPTVPTLEVAP